MVSESYLFSHLLVIKQIHFFVELPDGYEHFDTVCNDLVQSGKFREFTYPDKNIFTEHLREAGEVSRTFEIAEAIEVLNLDLIETRLSGKLRLLVTIYRSGFVVLWIVHSMIPEREEAQVKGNNLTPEKPLKPVDIIFLINEQIVGQEKCLKYDLQLQNQKSEMNTVDLVGYLLKQLEAQGIVVRRKPKGTTYLIHCWSPSLPAFPQLLKKNYNDLFLLFTAPQKGSSQRTKEMKLKELEGSLGWSTKNRGFFVRQKSMLIVSPVSRRPHRILFSQLPWIFQLASTQFFMLQFYSMEIRGLMAKMSALISDKPAELLSEVFKLSSAFSLSLEDLYWVEDDLFRKQATQFIAEYKKRVKLGEKLRQLQQRFAWLRERCTEAMATIQYRTEREKSIMYLTLIFATFGLGEILSSLTLWYLSFLHSTGLPIHYWLIALGFSIPFVAISILYLLSRWYVGSRY